MLYTFFARQPDGTALAFDAVELEDEMLVMRHMLKMVKEHPSAAAVSVWCGDRHVATRDRHELV